MIFNAYNLPEQELAAQVGLFNRVHVRDHHAAAVACAQAHERPVFQHFATNRARAHQEVLEVFHLKKKRRLFHFDEKGGEKERERDQRDQSDGMVWRTVLFFRVGREVSKGIFKRSNEVTIKHTHTTPYTFTQLIPRASLSTPLHIP